MSYGTELRKAQPLFRKHTNGDRWYLLASNGYRLGTFGVERPNVMPGTHVYAGNNSSFADTQVAPSYHTLPATATNTQSRD